MQKTDKSIIIIPYKTEDYDNGAISKMTKLPECSTSIKTYFNGMIPKDKGGDIYTGVLLAHNKPFGDIEEDVKFWAHARGHKLYQRQLAAEKVDSLGYLMYSVRSMSTEDLKSALWEKGIDAELRWRTMQVEETYVKYPQGKSSLDALQIRVVSDQVAKASNILRTIYSSTSGSNQYLLEIKMRYIPDQKHLLSPAAKDKLRDVLIKQLSFINAVKQLTTENILVLNKPLKGDGPTLREIILRLPCCNNCKQKIFIALIKCGTTQTSVSLCVYQVT